MKRFFTCIIFGSLIMLLGIISAYAGFNEIIVTNDQSAETVLIETDQPTLDIPIVVRGISDVYAFNFSMSYSPENIRVESISLGGIFSGFGSAVVKNDINNTTGQVRLMQTILVADHGADGNGTLCTVRLTLKPGEYDIARDLGVKIKIANSAAKYIDAYIADGKISVAGTESEGDTQPTPEISPVATAMIGIITPAPGSGENFELAEDKDVDTILQEIAKQEAEEPQKSVSPESDAAAVATKVEQGEGMPLWLIIVICVSTLVLAGGISVLIYVKRRRKYNYTDY